jgi:hypothetical protein
MNQEAFSSLWLTRLTPRVSPALSGRRGISGKVLALAGIVRYNAAGYGRGPSTFDLIRHTQALPLPSHVRSRNTGRGRRLGLSSGLGVIVKKGTTQLSKFKLLAKRLQLPDWQVVGLLESLWMFAQSESPAGDIGTRTDEAIAIQIGVEASEWRRFRDAMIAEGWLDPDSRCRFVIHDFEDHAPSWTKKLLDRAGMTFIVADGGGPYAPLRPPLSANGSQIPPVSNHGRTTGDHGSPSYPIPSSPSPTQPNPPPPPQTQPAAGTPPRTAGEEEVFSLLRKRPDWMPEGKGWIDHARADELCRLPTSTPEVVAFSLSEVKQGRATLKDPAGLFVKKMREPNIEGAREMSERNQRLKDRLNGTK